jgi:hypothetical protein
LEEQFGKGLECYKQSSAGNSGERPEEQNAGRHVQSKGNTDEVSNGNKDCV